MRVVSTPRRYDKEVLIASCFDLTATQLINADVDPSDARRLLLEYARRERYRRRRAVASIEAEIR